MPVLFEAPQLSNGKSQYSVASHSSLLVHSTPPPPLLLSAALLLSAGVVLDDDSPAVDDIVVGSPEGPLLLPLPSLDSSLPHAKKSEADRQRRRRCMRRVEHRPRSGASLGGDSRRMLSLMSSPWRIAALLVLVTAHAGPGVTGCFAERCTDPVDEELSGDELTVTLRNDTGATLFVVAGEGCDWQPFAMERGGDAVKWYRGACDWSCEDVLDSCACAAECAASSLVRLDPGASYDVVWDLALFAAEDLSLDCPAEGCPTRCTRRTVAGEGGYRITAAAGPDCVDGDASCACEAGANACLVHGELGGTATATAEASFTLPDDEVVLAFH